MEIGSDAHIPSLRIRDLPWPAFRRVGTVAVFYIWCGCFARLFLDGGPGLICERQRFDIAFNFSPGGILSRPHLARGVRSGADAVEY